MHALGLVHLVGGNVLDGGSATLGFPCKLLHQQHVDDAVEVGACSHGVLNGHAVLAIGLLQLVQNLVEVAMLAVELVNQEDDGLLQLVGVAEGVHRANLGAVLSVDDDNGLVGDVQGCDGTAHEVVGTWAVDEVKLLAVPLCVEDG